MNREKLLEMWINLTQAFAVTYVHTFPRVVILYTEVNFIIFTFYARLCPKHDQDYYGTAFKQ